MKSVLLVLLMTTNVIAFKQIFAINAGGEAHTDSDGIVYQRRVEKHSRFNSNLFDTGNIPDKDKLIYQNVEYSSKPDQLQYDIPLKNDGMYLLIAKFSTNSITRETDMVLNGKIPLLMYVDVYELCGGDDKTCDIYFYFCIMDGTLYYQNQSLLLQNEIHIEIRPIEHSVILSGLVLLEGSPDERQKLVSSNTNEFLDFDQTKMHPRCTKTKTSSINSLESNQNVTANFCEIKLNNITELLNQQFPKIQTDVMSSIEQAQIEFILQQNQSTGRMDIKFERLQLAMTTKIEKLHNKSTEQMNKLQSELATKADQTNKNFEKLQADVQQLAEIQQKSDEKQLEVQSAMKTSIEQCQKSSNQNQQMRYQKKSTEQLNNKIEKLQLDFATKTNQTNKNFEKLQADVQQLADFQQKSDEKQAAMKTSIERNQESSNQIIAQQMMIHTSLSEATVKSNQANKNIEVLQVSVQQLVEDNQKMRAEIKQMNLEVQTEQASLKSAILEMTKLLNVTAELVMTNEERHK
jgi:Malectin domain